jgi:hypothetical protein
MTPQLKVLAILLVMGLLLIPMIPESPMAKADDASSDIEILYFDVPTEFRVDTRYMVTAGIRNNGQVAIQNLRVEFPVEDGVTNWSTVPIIEPGNTTNVSVEIWTIGTSGRTLNITVDAGGTKLTIQRLIKPYQLQAVVSIRDFSVSPEHRVSRDDPVVQKFSFHLVLINEGENVGVVNLTVTAKGDGVNRIIFARNYSVSNQTPQEVYFDWVYRARPTTYLNHVDYRAEITGGLGNRGNLSMTRTDIHVFRRQTEDTSFIVMVVIGIVLPLSALGILLELWRLKKKAL